MKNAIDEKLGRLRKVAGAYARYGFNIRCMLASVILGLTLGLLISPYLYNLIIMIGAELPPSFVMTISAFIIVLGIVLYVRRLEKTWLVGYLAEKRVGDCIESLLTRGNFAVAHSIDFLVQGDIDHLVATPTELWVIETKYRRLPGKNFKKALERLQYSAERVKQEFGSSVPIRRVLILTEGQQDKSKEIYDEDIGKPVYVWDLDKFREKLKEHIRSIRRDNLDENMTEVVNKVWGLSTIEMENHGYKNR